MKILHTSDWHIGKKLNGKSRIAEQREVLFELKDICDAEKVDLVLVAGDIFDTFTPSSEAEELFFDIIEAIATPDRALIIISGNHDDWRRLAASALLASKSNVYIFGGERAPACGKGSVFVESAGKYHCVVKNASERLYVGVLPYPGEQRFGEKKDEQTFDEKMQEWINACFAENTENLPQILLSHLFMLGGIGTDGERQIELGGTRIVGKELIPENCIYTALGHLHKRQIIDLERHILYSGSLLQYSFDEAGYEKSVTIFQVQDGKVSECKKIPFAKGKKLARLTAVGIENGKQLCLDNEDKLIQLTLHIKDVLTETQSKELMAFPNLIELKLVRTGQERDLDGADRRMLNDKQAFTEYYKYRYGNDIPDDLLEEFMKLMQE